MDGYTSLDPESILADGMRRHKGGDMLGAKSAYERVLELRSDDPHALHMLGLIAHQRGDHELAASLMEESIRRRSDVSFYYSNLAECWRALRQWDKAIASCERALQVDKKSPDAHINLGNCFRSKGELERAIVHYKTALTWRPNDANALINLVRAYCEGGDFKSAIEPARLVIRLLPNQFEGAFMLGIALRYTGDTRGAFQAFGLAVRLRPHDLSALNHFSVCAHHLGALTHAVWALKLAIKVAPADWMAYFTMGNIMLEKRYETNADKLYEKASILNPRAADVWNNWALLAKDQGQLLLAKERLQQCLSLNDANADAWDKMGLVYREMAEHSAAIVSFRKAINLGSRHAGSHLLHTLQLTCASGSQIRNEARVWGDRVIKEVPPKLLQPSDRKPGRVRVGYLSADFVQHPISYFIVGLLENHNREYFEIYCYSAARREDEWTYRLQSKVEHWVFVAGLTDEELLHRIQVDELDLLVDLAGHTGRNRLAILARKPARVQATYLGYPGSTGLKTVDYRITDVLADPPVESSDHYVEKLLYLDRCAWCYQPPRSIAKRTFTLCKEGEDTVTFGCFNGYYKIADELLNCWANILSLVKRSRLVLKQSAFNDARFAEITQQRFRAFGIEPSRVTFLPETPRLADHLLAYDDIDVALDTYPYHGTTTTCDALWMGVPVVSWCGARHASRVGASLLTAVGLQDLAAASADEYVQRAVTLAYDLPRRADLRGNLRTRMEKSPLMDAPGFARSFENAIRDAIGRG